MIAHSCIQFNYLDKWFGNEKFVEIVEDLMLTKKQKSFSLFLSKNNYTNILINANGN